MSWLFSKTNAAPKYQQIGSRREAGRIVYRIESTRRRRTGWGAVNEVPFDLQVPVMDQVDPSADGGVVLVRCRRSDGLAVIYEIYGAVGPQMEVLGDTICTRNIP